MAKEYRLYALVYVIKDNSIISVNSSYCAEGMASAQALFEADLKARNMIPLSILSDAQVKKKIHSCLKPAH